MSDLIRLQKISEKLSNLNLQPETLKQSRIDSSENKFRQIESKFEEFIEFSEKRRSLLKEQISKLEKNADEEKRIFNSSLSDRLKSLSNLESQFAIWIDHEIKAI